MAKNIILILLKSFLSFSLIIGLTGFSFLPPLHHSYFHKMSLESDDKIPKGSFGGDLTLFYFDLPGKGEAIRLFCVHNNIPLTDKRITREEFEVLKKDKLAYGQVGCNL